MFDASVEAIVNTVNLVGVMGKGVALQFKKRFPENFNLYVNACNNGTIGIGNSLVTETLWRGKKMLIVNLPTKVDWRNPSQYSYVERGLENLLVIINKYNIRSIAIPPLGAGNGGLDWEVVKRMIDDKLCGVDCDILVYEPGYVAESMDKKVNLTPARALLVYMLEKLQHECMDATVFTAVKLIYFMQKFGAQSIFKLTFRPYIYGPYNDSVRHMLHHLDGAYIRGFADMNKRPFEPFGLIDKRMDDVRRMVEGDLMLNDIVCRTSEFLEDNWEDFKFELLSSVDYLMTEYPQGTEDDIYNRLCAWSERKCKLFGDKQWVYSAYAHIKTGVNLNTPPKKRLDVVDCTNDTI